MGAGDPKKAHEFDARRGAQRATPAWLSLVSPPRAFSRVPTHAVGVAHDRRTHARAALNLPLRLTQVAGRIEPTPLTLLTQNISTTGVLFLSPKHIEPGTPIELEVGLVNRPLGHGSVRMATAARVVRVDVAATPGWHGVAAAFDDIAFDRDEPVPSRFKP